MSGQECFWSNKMKAGRTGREGGKARTNIPLQGIVLNEVDLEMHHDLLSFVRIIVQPQGDPVSLAGERVALSIKEGETILLVPQSFHRC